MLLWNTQMTHIYNKLLNLLWYFYMTPFPPPKQANKNSNNSSWTEKEIYLQSLDLNTWSFDLILCMSKWRLSVKACPGCNQHFKCNREQWPQSLPHMHRCRSWPGNGTRNTQVQKMCCWWRMKRYDAGTCSQSRHDAKHFFTTSLSTTKKEKTISNWKSVVVHW